MKALIIWFTVSMASCFVSTAEEVPEWPYPTVSLALRNSKGVPLPEEVREERPESFKWQEYIEKGTSTIEQRERALQATLVLWNRLLDVEKRERAKRLKLSGKGSAEVFDEMQKQWRLLCALESRDYSGPVGTIRGSGWKAYFPSFVSRQIHR